MEDKRWIAAIVGLIALLGSCVGCAVLFGLGLHFYEGGQLAGDRAMPPLPRGPDDDGPSGERPSDEGEMRRRYRPGPHVSVEGMLPSGRLAVQRMEDGDRSGRTLDTPWIVGGAELRPSAAPSADSPSPSRPTLVSGDAGGALTVIAGVPARLPIHATAGAGADDTEVRGLFIAFHDYPGHFFLPATVDTELGQIEVAGVDAAELVFGLDAAIDPSGAAIVGAPREVVMYVAAVDVAGRVSPYLQRRLSITPVGTGDVEVTLTMSRSTDLDLYVVDAGGSVVYYGNSPSGSNGTLDLDANAACGNNIGVDNEHIFWPAGAAPAGTYTVRVAHYESCIGNAPVDYRVTVENCGEIVVLTGSFVGAGNTESCSTMDRDDRAWCQQVVEFEVSACEGATPAAPAAPAGPIGRPGRIL